MPDWEQRIKETPTATDTHASRRLILLVYSDETRKLAQEGKLDSLKPEAKAGLIITRGRYDEGRFFEMTGKPYLPILPANSRLSLLIARAAHEEDHRQDPNNIAARMRNHAWILKARILAKRAIKSCMECRKRSTKTSKQIMAELPKEVLQEAAPFTCTALDLFGPLMAKGVGGHARKVFKTWGVLFTCLGTKAVSIWLAGGYDAESFLLCYQRQTAIYGIPNLVISDQGSQLMSAAKEIKEWQALQEAASRQGTEWKVTPAGCAWRNGQAERAVGLAKHTLQQVVDSHELLNVFELETALLQVAAIINRRPLTARIFGQDDYHAICPADLLLGKISGYNANKPYTWQDKIFEPTQIKQNFGKIAALTDRWWVKWSRDAFPLMCPRQKWTKERRNIKVGDIVMLVSANKLGKGSYKLARVHEVHPDKQGIVRTVTIASRDKVKARGEKPDEIKGGLTFNTMAVQRLVVLIPAEETWDKGFVVTE